MVPATHNHSRRFGLVTLAAIFLWPSINACTVKRAPVRFGAVPVKIFSDPQAEKYGRNVFQQLRDDYDLDTDNQNYRKLIEVFHQLTKAAGADHLRWHIYLLNGRDIVDVRAVHGNYLFVWSGVLDAVANDDELAGLLAWELAHALAYHTDPVQFTLASNILFNAAELATSLGLLVATQGAVAIGGAGWMKWAYIEAIDLDSLDRNYSKAEEREAAHIALIILSRSPYSPQALIGFWNRAAKDDALQDQSELLNRSMSPRERSVMLEQLLFQHPPCEYQ